MSAFDAVISEASSEAERLEIAAINVEAALEDSIGGLVGRRDAERRPGLAGIPAPIPTPCPPLWWLSLTGAHPCLFRNSRDSPFTKQIFSTSLEQMRVFTPEHLAEFVDAFIVKKLTSDKLQPFFQRIVSTGYLPLAPEEKDSFRKETGRYVRQYSFISQIMTFTDTALAKFYLFAKLLLRQLPYEKQTLPLEVIDMIDMDKFRLQEEQNGRIALAAEDGILEPTGDDGHRGRREEEKEKLKVIVQKLNEDYGLDFNEADRVVNAIKEKLEADEGLKAAFKTNSVDFLRRQKLQDSIRDAFLSNADEFLNFMSKTETDPAFGKFFFSEMFKWYSQTVGPGNVP